MMLNNNSTILDKKGLLLLKQNGEFTGRKFFVINGNLYFDEVTEEMAFYNDESMYLHATRFLWTHRLTLRSLISKGLLLHSSILTNILSFLTVTQVKMLHSMSPQVHSKLHYLLFNESDGYMQINTIQKDFFDNFF